VDPGFWLALGGSILAAGGVIAGRGFAVGRMTTLIDGLQKNFDKFQDEIKQDVRRVNERCEARLKICTEHFSGIDKHVAAIRGKANEQ
jgi:hypothetical protein